MKLSRTKAGLTGAVLVAATVASTMASPSQARTATESVTTPKAAASCTAPVPPARPTSFGLSVKAAPTLAANVTTLKSKFGPFRVARVFDPGLPPSNAWERRGTALANMQVSTSFRMPPSEVLSGKYDAALRQFFQSAPSNIQVYWTYYHEPEPLIAAGQFTAAQYRAAWQRIANIAGSLCRPNLYPTLILTGWTADPASHRNWRDYYPGDTYVSVLGWDPYNQAVGTPTTYRSPQDVFSDVITVSDTTDKPWAIAETGTARTSSDVSGVGRAAWIKASGSYLKSHGALWVAWFQSTVKGDFELRDQPGISAYSALVGG